jgi:hypothetical protein
MLCIQIMWNDRVFYANTPGVDVQGPRGRDAKVDSSSRVASREEEEDDAAKRKRLPKAPNPLFYPASGDLCRRSRRWDVIGDPPSAGGRLCTLPVVHPHRHRQRRLYLPYRVRAPAAPGTPQTLTLAGLPACNVAVASVQVGGRGGAAPFFPQCRTEAAPPQHWYAALRYGECYFVLIWWLKASWKCRFSVRVFA